MHHIMPTVEEKCRFLCIWREKIAILDLLKEGETNVKVSLVLNSSL